MKYVLVLAVLGMAVMLSGCPPVATIEPLYMDASAPRPAKVLAPVPVELASIRAD